MTGDLKSDLKSNAPLDVETITRLGEGILSSNVMDEFRFMSRPTFFRAEHTFGFEFDPSHLVSMRTTSCQDALTAQNMMLDCLSTFQAPVQEATTKPEKTLG